nr:unnamed protein product [Callosobruchus analis]
MDLNLLQINVDRGRRAHAILYATAIELQADIILVQVPNKAIVSSGGWYCDLRKDAAIKIRRSDIPVYKEGAGNGFTWLDIGEVIFYSCYFSPNADLTHPILDLTLSTEGVSVKLNDWSVLDRESLSLHRYISFKMRRDSNILQDEQDVCHGWAVKRIDVNKFNTTLCQVVSESNINSAEHLVTAIKTACDQSMP